MRLISRYLGVFSSLFLIFFLLLLACQEHMEEKPSKEKISQVTEPKQLIEELPQDSIFEIDIPDDSLLTIQIINSMELDSFTRFAFFETIQINNTRYCPSGFVIETSSQGGAPCEQIQVSSFDRNAKIIQVMPLTLGCDCPSECEGCEWQKSIDWQDNTHFNITEESTNVLNSNEELARLNYEDCDTKTTYSKTACSINGQGAINIGHKKKITRKEALLQALKGKHSLSAISGFSGANTMYDYTQTNQVWDAHGSSIHQARREPFDIVLDAEEVSILQGLQISVQKDLSVDVMVNDTSIISIPFNPNGLLLELSRKPEAYIMGVPDSLTPSTTLINELLYLATRDQLGGNALSPIDLVIGIADAYTLAFNVIENRFELTLFYADCCDNATYLFKNQKNY